MTRIAILTAALLAAAAAAAVSAQENGAGTAKPATLRVGDNPERASETLHSEVDEYFLFREPDCGDFNSQQFQLPRHMENAIPAGRPVYVYGQSVITSLFVDKSICGAVAKFTPEPGHKYEAHHRWGDGRSNTGCSIQVVDKATGAPPPSFAQLPLTGECQAVSTYSH